MRPEVVFVDTSALLALCSGRDHLHARARTTVAQLAALRIGFVTSQWVLAEFLNSAAGGPLRGSAISDVNRLLNSPVTDIVPATSQSWSTAFDLYQARSDKGWSLVDCSSILICQQRGIRRILTHDRHFEQAGFEAMLR